MRVGRFSKLEKTTVAELELDVFIATGYRARLSGLSGLTRQEIRPLLIPGCRSIHTFGMRCEIDAVFFNMPDGLSGRAEVISIRKRLKPFRAVWLCRACSVLELWPGAIESLGVTVGKTLTFARHSEGGFPTQAAPQQWSANPGIGGGSGD